MLQSVPQPQAWGSLSVEGQSSRLARTIDFRSGAVIAVSRIVLATVFFLALWVDPSQPVRATGWGYGLLLGYLLVAWALVFISRLSWWFDHRLAWPALLIDIGVFLAGVYFTEGASDFTSPFLAFFAFLMLATTIRWNWRVTAWVGLATTALYLVVGLMMATAGIEFDLFRFTRRVIYMIVLSLVLVWFGFQRRERHVDRFSGDGASGGERGAFLDEVMGYAMTQCGAPCAILAWADDEEPWAELRAHGVPLEKRRLGPDEFDPVACATRPVRLFDRKRNRQLIAARGRRPVAVAGPTSEPLGRILDIDEGLALPLSGSTGRGELLLVGIRVPTSDHVEIGEHLAREIGAAFDRLAMTALVRSAAVAHTRDAVARDLHDSVAQALAGASFRLEGLRSWIRAGRDPEPEIAEIKQALRSEQQHVRSLIARLRAGVELGGESDLVAALGQLADDLSRQWGMAVELVARAPARVPVWLDHEIQQLVREAVANAVRHGAATKVTLRVAEADRELSIAVEDNGRGFPIESNGSQPWSLHDRVKSLGGTMTLTSDDLGTCIAIRLPLEGSR